MKGRSPAILPTPAWQVIKITGEGWQAVPDVPIKFRRAKGTQPLPCPAMGGSLDDLRSLLNINGILGHQGIDEGHCGAARVLRPTRGKLTHILGNRTVDHDRRASIREDRGREFAPISGDRRIDDYEHPQVQDRRGAANARVLQEGGIVHKQGRWYRVSRAPNHYSPALGHVPRHRRLCGLRRAIDEEPRCRDENARLLRGRLKGTNGGDCAL